LGFLNRLMAKRRVVGRIGERCGSEISASAKPGSITRRSRRDRHVAWFREGSLHAERP